MAGYRFYFDYSHLECMQKSTRDSAVAFTQMVNGMILAVQNGFVTEEVANRTINDFIR